MARSAWDYVFGALPKDNNFWQTQVHGPALAWIAAGSRGSPRTPAEQLASNFIQGGIKAITPIKESAEGTKENSSRRSIKAQEKKRQETIRRWRKPWRQRLKLRKRERRKQRNQRPSPAEVLQLEQRKWAMWLIGAGSMVSGEK